ncbi:MAG TPA: helix-turn-helix domain-containing protein [Terriglobales bacterium]|nr:helix-turn-helix domain-containing protein [Terriglobales bacterium]
MKLDDMIREAIEEAVARNGGDKIAAAKELGIGKSTVYRLLTKYEEEKRRRQRKRAKKAKKKRAGKR